MLIHDPVNQLRTPPALECFDCLVSVCDVIAKPLQREIERAIVVERIAQVEFLRLWQAEPVFSQSIPWKQLARIGLARWRNIGMTDNVCAGNIILFHYPRQ